MEWNVILQQKNIKKREEGKLLKNPTFPSIGMRLMEYLQWVIHFGEFFCRFWTLLIFVEKFLLKIYNLSFIIIVFEQQHTLFR